MKKNINKKVIVGVLFIIIIGLAVLLVINLVKNDSNKQEQLISINEFIESNNYSVIDITEEIDNIFDSLKKYIYTSDRNSIDDFKKEELFSIISYNVKSDDIIVEKQDGEYTYGYVNKDLLNDQIDAIFGKNTISIDKNKYKMSISYGTFDNAGNIFKNAVLISQNDEEYYFRFYAGEGTSVCPTIIEIPIKLTEIRKIDNYLLLISKAIYTNCTSQESVNKNIINIYANPNKSNKLDSFELSLDTDKYEINLEDYIDDASEIYLLLKSDKKGNYHFYSSKINSND